METLPSGEDLDEELSVIHIPDKVVKSKARASLPNLLAINKSPNGLCVVSKCLIQKGTQFGPLSAPLATQDLAAASPFLMKLPINGFPGRREAACYYNTTDENQCNWMCLVRPATNTGEQNLSACMKLGKIFFLTTKQIRPHEELKVWYSKQFATFMGKPLLISISPTIDNNQSGSKRVRRTNTPTFAPYFEDEEIKEAEVRNVPPKKRGWRRANMKMLKEPTEKNQDVSSSLMSDKVTEGQSLGEPGLDHRLLSESQPHKLFTCSICLKAFKRKHSLAVHSVVHSDKMSFLCHACGKRFKRKDKLAEHFKRMHRSKDNNPNLTDPATSKPSASQRFHTKSPDLSAFKCQHCSIGFRRRGMLVNHVQKKHPGVDLNSIPVLSEPLLKTSVRFICPYCLKSYKSVSKRSSHIRKHHPGQHVPPGLRAVKKNDLYPGNPSESHVACLEVKEVKPYHCPYCPSQYSSKNKLCRHVSRKHQLNPKAMQAQRKKNDNGPSELFCKRFDKYLCHHQCKKPPATSSTIETIDFAAADVTRAFEDAIEGPTDAVPCDTNLFVEQTTANVLGQCVDMEGSTIEQVAQGDSADFQAQLGFGAQQPSVVPLTATHQPHQADDDPMQFVSKVGHQTAPHIANHAEEMRVPLLCDFPAARSDMERQNTHNLVRRHYIRPRKHHLLQAQPPQNPKPTQSNLPPAVSYPAHRPQSELDRQPQCSSVILEQNKGAMNSSYPPQNSNVQPLQTSPANWNYPFNIEYQAIGDLKVYTT